MTSKRVALRFLFALAASVAVYEAVFWVVPPVMHLLVPITGKWGSSRLGDGWRSARVGLIVNAHLPRQRVGHAKLARMISAFLQHFMHGLELARSPALSVPAGFAIDSFVLIYLYRR
jgi:hypothetical protein